MARAEAGKPDKSGCLAGSPCRQPGLPGFLMPARAIHGRVKEDQMIWTILNAIATLISMVAFVVTALYIRAELKGLEKDRYLNVTGEIFAIWQSKEFMEAQLWLLHKLQATTWQEFVEAHRGDF